MKDNAILLMPRRAFFPHDGPAHRLAKLSGYALIGQDGRAAGIKVQKSVTNMGFVIPQPGMDLDYDHLSQYEPAPGKEAVEPFRNLAAQGGSEIGEHAIE